MYFWRFLRCFCIQIVPRYGAHYASKACLHCNNCVFVRNISVNKVRKDSKTPRNLVNYYYYYYRNHKIIPKKRRLISKYIVALNLQ